MNIRKSIAQLLFSFVLLVSFFTLSLSPAFANDMNSTIGFAAHNGKTPGTVHLVWSDKDYIESYNISYGPSSGNYLYGVTNVGNVSEYTIGALTPGQRYYFVLSPIDDGNAMAYTYEVSAVAGGGVVHEKKMVTDHKEMKHDSASSHKTPVVATSEHTYTKPMQAVVDPAAMTTGNDEDKNFHLWAVQGDTPGTIKLTWDNKGYTETYNIVYGTTPGDYKWGVVNTGHVGEYTIGALTPGVRYYFALSAVDDGTAFPYTPYVSAVAR